MRKYLLNAGILAAVFSVFGLMSRTLAGPRNLRLLLAWAGWAVGAVAAVLTVREDSAEASEYYALRDAERDAKRPRSARG